MGLRVSGATGQAKLKVLSAEIYITIVYHLTTYLETSEESFQFYRSFDLLLFHSVYFLKILFCCSKSAMLYLCFLSF